MACDVTGSTSAARTIAVARSRQHRLTAQFLYVRDDPRVADDALKELCRKSLTKSGLLPTSDD